MGIDVESYRARIGTFITKNSSNGESEKRLRTAARLKKMWIVKYCTSQVSDVCPYWSVCWCSEQNCVPTYSYKGAIESDLYTLKPLQVHVYSKVTIRSCYGLLLFATRTYTTGAGGTSSRQTGGEGPIDDGGGLCGGDSTLAVSNVRRCGGEPRTFGSAHQR